METLVLDFTQSVLFHFRNPKDYIKLPSCFGLSCATTNYRIKNKIKEKTIFKTKNKYYSSSDRSFILIIQRNVT